MPSPFPGMDPWLEGHLWPDVHQRLAGEVARWLTPRLRPRYVARLSTRYVADLGDTERGRVLYPDVDVSLVKPVSEVAALYEVDAATASPATLLPLIIEQRAPPRIRLVSVEIRDSQDEQLVTSIEILSPVNKHGDGFAEYQQKRWLVIESAAHLLEIDLLRTGRRPVLLDRVEEKDRPRVEEAAYFCFLTRYDRGRKVEVWPLDLREPLPVLPVPLLAPDKDVSLELGSALGTIYDEAAYDLSINYGQPPKPALQDNEAAWANGVLCGQGLR